MIKVVAHNFAKPSKFEEVLPILKELVDETRKEKGCISYDLCQDPKNKDHIVIIEEWESMEILEAHFVTEHFKRLVPAVGQLCIPDDEIPKIEKLMISEKIY